jgi:hypothetical protein
MRPLGPTRTDGEDGGCRVIGSILAPPLKRLPVHVLGNWGHSV